MQDKQVYETYKAWAEARYKVLDAMIASAKNVDFEQVQENIKQLFKLKKKEKRLPNI